MTMSIEETHRTISVRLSVSETSLHAERTVTASYDEAFRREWRHSHECVTTGVAPRTGGADGLRDVEILRTIVRSAGDGRPASL